MDNISEGRSYGNLLWTFRKLGDAWSVAAHDIFFGTKKPQ